VTVPPALRLYLLPAALGVCGLGMALMLAGVAVGALLVPGLVLIAVGLLLVAAGALVESLAAAAAEAPESDRPA
jgi:hypothetical protein